MNIRLVFILGFILIFSGGCSRLVEKMLVWPEGTMVSPEKPYYGELEMPELQPPDQYRFEAPEATVLIEDNEVYSNNRSAIRIRGDLPVHISRCNFYNNGTAGIRADASARIYIDESRIYANRTGGIDLLSTDEFYCRDCLIFMNGEGGIRIRSGDGEGAGLTMADIRDSRIYLNGQAGLRVQAGPESSIFVILAANAVFGNGNAGVRIEDGTRLTAWNNVLYNNATAGISTVAPSGRIPEMDIFQNRICFNHGAGLFIQAGITGQYGISNNWIYNNYRAGIGCGLAPGGFRDRSRLAILHNTIVANGSAALGAGIRDDTGGVVVVRNNIIVWNLRTGMMVGNCNDASHNLVFANGEQSSFDEDDEYAYLFERMQYAGCPGRGVGDVIDSPMFVDPDQYDFSLKDGSPAVDAGEEIDSAYFSWFGRRDMGSLVIPPGPAGVVMPASEESVAPEDVHSVGDSSTVEQGR